MFRNLFSSVSTRGAIPSARRSILSSLTRARLFSSKAKSSSLSRKFAKNECKSNRTFASAAAVASRQATRRYAPFPTLSISAKNLVPQGTFAEAQADYLQPDMDRINNLDKLLEAENAGIVAHFYMDPELQGALAHSQWPHIFLGDSLAMGDQALKMAEAGVEKIIVLGVDFMSENVQATLRANGFDTPVFRCVEKDIGCSLAESAEKLAYNAWLTKASETANSLHVVYINTSLRTKANSESLVPTITCTSSNVVRTVLQAASQFQAENDGEHLTVWFGPDTYMGENLEQMFTYMANHLTDEQIAKIHPAHNRETMQNLLKHFNYFGQGNCVVHHMFGADVVNQVQQVHPTAYHTAHLEVPGEMFELALDAQNKDRGVVGSTSDILNFIVNRMKQVAAEKSPSTSQFVLGTEAGMITPIVKQVQELLQQAQASEDVRCEIVFPVSSSAMVADDASSDNNLGLGLVPGVAEGEGCSVGGGCATCPFMKMNNFDALMDLLGVELPDKADVSGYHPKEYTPTPGEPNVSLGVVPITSMRYFQANGVLSPELMSDIKTRSGPK